MCCRFLEDQVHDKEVLIEKLTLKNTTFKAAIAKLEAQLAHKEEMGEVRSHPMPEAALVGERSVLQAARWQPAQQHDICSRAAASNAVRLLQHVQQVASELNGRRGGLL